MCYGEPSFGELNFEGLCDRHRWRSSEPERSVLATAAPPKPGEPYVHIEFDEKGEIASATYMCPGVCHAPGPQQFCEKECCPGCPPF